LLQSDENKAEIKIFRHKSLHIVKLDYFVHCTPVLLVIPVSDASNLLNRIVEVERSVASKDQ